MVDGGRADEYRDGHKGIALVRCQGLLAYPRCVLLRKPVSLASAFDSGVTPERIARLTQSSPGDCRLYLPGCPHLCPRNILLPARCNAPLEGGEEDQCVGDPMTYRSSFCSAWSSLPPPRAGSVGKLQGHLQYGPRRQGKQSDGKEHGETSPARYR